MAIFHFLVTCSVRFCHILRVFYYIYYVSFPIHDNDGGISSSFHTSFVTVPLDGDGRSDTKYVIISTFCEYCLHASLQLVLLKKLSHKLNICVIALP